MRPTLVSPRFLIILVWAVAASVGSVTELRATTSAAGECVATANTVPPVPTLLSPKTGLAVPFYALRLTVQNVHDPDTDPRTQNFDSVFFDFEIFDDSTLINRVAAANRVPSGSQITRSSEFNNLTLARQYWWRARSRDQYESSDWSEPESFETRSGMVISVDATQDGIGRGIASAWDGDTVLVAPGQAELWYGVQMFDWRIVLKSEHGPYATILRNVNAGNLIRIGEVKVGAPGHGVVLDGFTIRSDRGLAIFSDRAEYTVNNCVFDTVAGHSILMRRSRATVSGCDFHPAGEESGLFIDESDLVAHHNLFTGGVAQPLIYITGSSAYVWNNTFASCWSGVGLVYNGSPVRCINNLFYGLGNYAIAGSMAIVEEDYNLYHANLQNMVGEILSGGHSVVVDPQFENYPGAGYSLSYTSPAIDAGHPDTSFRDNDGSISDIGAFGHWPQPQLIGPLNEVVEDLTPRFEWTPVSPGEVTYTLLISQDSSLDAANAIVLDSTSCEWPIALWGGAHYSWQVLASTELGTRFRSSVGSFDTYPPPFVPSTFGLLQNYPNPFNAETIIPVDLPQFADWTLTIYNVMGQTVRTISGITNAGRLLIRWDGTTDDMKPAASGLYPYKFSGGGFVAVNKMVILR